MEGEKTLTVFLKTWVAASWIFSVGSALLFTADRELRSVRFPDDEAVERIERYELVFADDWVVNGLAVLFFPVVFLVLLLFMLVRG